MFFVSDGQPPLEKSIRNFNCPLTFYGYNKKKNYRKKKSVAELFSTQLLTLLQK